MSNTTEVTGSEQLDWYPRHIVAMCFQVLSLIGSGLIITSFFLLKNRRSPFHFEVLFLNIADFIWTASHFINHTEAIANGHVTKNEDLCIAMGMFTHLGIGWELCWLSVFAIHTALVISGAGKNKIYYPSKTTMVIVTAFCWIFPLVWWTVIGISVEAYNSTGYFCWVKFEPQYISLLFGDIPLLICCIIVFVCYTFVIAKLAKLAADKKFRDIGGSSFKREIRRSILYIVVYIIWVHPYLAVTIIVMAKGTISRGLWLYFLAIINSLGSMNFFAYGISERWFTDIKAIICCKPQSYSSSFNKENNNRRSASARRSQMDGGKEEEVELPKISENEEVIKKPVVEENLSSASSEA